LTYQMTYEMTHCLKYQIFTTMNNARRFLSESHSFFRFYLPVNFYFFYPVKHLL
jgi:hypothetical protein